MPQSKLPEPFHVSEAELAETRARLKREAAANRPRYQAQDAALSTLTKEEYRALLESVLARHIAEAAEAADPAEPEEARLFQFEINGLCIALRLLGGYEVPQPHTGTERVAFDLDWAREVAPASFDWRAFLGYAGTSEEGAEPTAPEPVEYPRARPGTRMLDLPPSSSDPLRQAGESIEELRKFHQRRRGRPRPRHLTREEE